MKDPDAATMNALLGIMLELPREQRAGWVESLGPVFDGMKPRLRALVSRSMDRSRRFTTLPKLREGAEAEVEAEPLQPQAAVEHFRLLHRLGGGGMGVVWLARDESSAEAQRLVALKFARVGAAASGLVQRLAREQRVLAALAHPNIAKLYGSGVTADGQPYLVLEYVQGLSLDAYCVARKASLALRLALFVQIADALAYAHARHIVHCDLKPDNVLVTSAGETRLLDFGIAKLLLDASTTSPSLGQLSVLYGRPVTPAYAAPEQLLGEPVTFASDIYSLAVMLYELIAHARPYTWKRGSNRALRDAIVSADPPPPSAHVADSGVRQLLQRGIDAMVLRALSKRPEDRQSSMQAFAAEIEHHTRMLSRLQS
jgi:serine/threonine-protein kinase